MITISDQFVLSLTIGNKKDFIQVEDLAEFTITEYAGGLLPTYILSFLTADESILSLLNEGNNIFIQYGKNNNSLKDSILFTGEISSNKEGSDKLFIEISGFAVSLRYITEPYSLITDKLSAIEALIATAKIDFKRVDTNIEKSKDVQNWIQPGISNRAFISHLMMRQDIMPSFIGVAIKADGTFLIRDILKTIKGEPKWKFLHSSEKGSNIINYNSDAAINSKPLYYNNWTGYEKEKFVLNFNTGAMEKVSTKFEPKIALAKEIDKDKTIKKRFNGFEIKNESVHENFWSSYDHNLVNLTQLSKVGLILSSMDEYRDVSPLDYVYFNQEDTKGNGASSEYTSGPYFVTRVSLSIQERRFVEVFTLNRESLNGARNS